MDLVRAAVVLLPVNEVACSGRLVCKDLHSRLPPARYGRVWLDQPVPLHAAGWPLDASFLDRLSFRRKLTMLSAAAATGCLTTLAVAWRLLQPCLVPGLPAKQLLDLYQPGEDPATVAVLHGHTHALTWLVRQGCPVDAPRALAAVAQHQPLKELCGAWELLLSGEGEQHGEGAAGAVCAEVEAAAAACRRGEARAKLEWLVEKGCKRGPAVAAAAARADNLELLRWLAGSDQAAPPAAAAVQHPDVAVAALQAGSLALLRWLVEEAGCGLVGDVAQHAAGSAREGPAKLRWLREARGVVPGAGALLQAARAGQLETVRYLHQECGLEPSAEAFGAAAESGHVPTASYLLTHGSPVDENAYRLAAEGGHLAMIRWLADYAHCPFHGLTVLSVIVYWPRSPSCGAEVLRDAEGGEHGEGSGGGGGAAGEGGADQAGAGLAPEAGTGGGGSAVGALEPGAGGAGSGKAGGGSAGCSGRGVGAGGVSGGGGGVSYSDCLAAVQLLHEAGCPLGGLAAMGCSASRGDLELVRYLHQHGCAFTAHTIGAAAEGGCVSMLDYLHAHGCSAGGVDGAAYWRAGRNGDLSMLRALRRLGVPWSDTTLAATVSGLCPLPVIQWLVSQGLPLTAEGCAGAVRAASRRQQEDVHGWLQGLVPQHEA